VTAIVGHSKAIGDADGNDDEDDDDDIPMEHLGGELIAMVEDIRESLGLEQNEHVTKEWIEAHPNQVLNFHLGSLTHLEEFIDDDDPRRMFTIMPHFSDGRSCIEVDTDAFIYCLATQFCLETGQDASWFCDTFIGKAPSSLKGSDDEKCRWWGKVFDLKASIRNGWTFQRTIRTDGVRFCAVQVRPKTEEELRAEAFSSLRYWINEFNAKLARRHKAPKALEKAITSLRWSHGRAIERGVVYMLPTALNERLEPLPTEVDITNKARGVFSDKTARGSVADADIVGIDPGRRDIMVACRPATGQTWKLSKKQYYEESGFRTSERLRNKMRQANPAYRNALLKLSECGPKTSCIERYLQHLHVRWKVRPVLWSEHGKVVYSNLKFRCYRLKYRCLDRFFHKIVKAVGPQALIAFGAAKFAVTSKGDVAGPVRSLSIRAGLHCRTVLTNEYYTSQKCSHCESQMEAPRMHTYNKKKRVYAVDALWGLKWCSTDRKLRSRDVNAAQNIARVCKEAIAGRERPQYLRRT
jgi:hypothetical protein